MVEVHYTIVIAGILCLSMIYITLAILDHDTSVIGMTIVGIIALAIGVILPTPKIDDKTGVLRW